MEIENSKPVIKFIFIARVCRKVAFDFQSNVPGDFRMHENKQIPCITSMLTRDIFFDRA